MWFEFFYCTKKIVYYFHLQRILELLQGTQNHGYFQMNYERVKYLRLKNTELSHFSL